MKAIAMNGVGGREMLEHVERPDPVLAPGQALVEIAFAGVNFMDIGVRQGVACTDIPNPKILGVEGAGRVLAVGEGVEGIAVGQRVVVGFRIDVRSEHARKGKDFGCRIEGDGEGGDVQISSLRTSEAGNEVADRVRDRRRHGWRPSDEREQSDRVMEFAHVELPPCFRTRGLSAASRANG
jgi:threonine dehydrogenase-like Zn-dependent dehydrogenase